MWPRVERHRHLAPNHHTDTHLYTATYVFICSVFSLFARISSSFALPVRERRIARQCFQRARRDANHLLPTLPRKKHSAMRVWISYEPTPGAIGNPVRCESHCNCMMGSIRLQDALKNVHFFKRNIKHIVTFSSLQGSLWPTFLQEFLLGKRALTDRISAEFQLCHRSRDLDLIILHGMHVILVRPWD